MNETNIILQQKTLSFEIKYGFLDYLSAINFKWENVTSIIKEKGKNKSWLVFKLSIIKPFVLLSISLFAFITKLKHCYKFNLSQDLFIRSHNDIDYEVKWPRFSSFEQNDKFIFLQLDKNKGESDGQVLIIKRVLKPAEIKTLIGFLKYNNIPEKRIDNEEIEALIKNN